MQITFTDRDAETRLISQRARFAALIIATLVLILWGRLVYLQVLHHDLYTTLSRDNRVKISPLTPPRGRIFDRNGQLLAENLPVFSLQVIPEQVENLKETLQTVGEIIELSPDELQRFHQLLKRKRRFEDVPLRLRLTDSEVAKIAVNLHRLPGIDIRAGLLRNYPHGPLLTHVLGYVGRIDEEELQSLDARDYRGITNIGKIGIEKSYEAQLRGTVGLERVETNAQGRVVRNLDRQPARPGTNIFLTIDTKLQQVADQAFGDESGALVAIEPSSGAVIALISKPSFDPNPMVAGIDQASFDALRNSESRPLFNRALRGQYPPGSTLKPFIGLAGLEYQLMTHEDSVDCEGHYLLEGDERKYRDWKKEGHGETNLDRALVESCDVYFYDLALKLGIDHIHEYLAQFGFGQLTGVDMTGELAGLLPSRQWKQRTRGLRWFPGETLITGIGQGFNLTTPMQLANATAALANYGQRIRPHLLYAHQPNGESDPLVVEPKSAEPIPIKLTQNWDRIINSMRRVVHSYRGSARRIDISRKYLIAGKTGTAQIFGIKQDEEYVQEDIAKRLRDHALFVAFAPVKSPRIAVAVIVENGGSGGAVAAPIARTVMDQYLLGEVLKPPTAVPVVEPPHG